MHCKLDPSHKNCVIKKGYFPRKTGKSERIQRYYCKACKKTFCERTDDYRYRERKSHLNEAIFRAICSSVSQRRIAIVLGISKNTVAKKCRRIALRARQLHARDMATWPAYRIALMDEMETFEHSKMKPVSIAVSVVERTRKLISVNAAVMPAKGLLAERSRKKYGRRRDMRPSALRRNLAAIATRAADNMILKTDESPRYPRQVQRFFPKENHHR